MEDIISYIILFTFGLTALYLYQQHKSKQRKLPLSVQRFADMIVNVIIVKQHGKTQEIIVGVMARKPVKLRDVHLEFIDKNRQIEIAGINSEKRSEIAAIPLQPGDRHHFRFEITAFQDFLKNRENPFSTFRFVVENSIGKKYKSHELALHTNWSIYRPDSGKYN